ncbi:hypothetical protein HHL28_17975 [Aerophototrophica crusticola]|uniref:Prolyl 4-hydroxylase alpha subunit domain-containing protein n=2 Tax=Aerophototrophica crusticola TaxID=1709002 RepID=A0A858RB60_9PROT|nr:hypothetical protein HHL28_17975 [Rhodospirillaceae bacterium B3]
MSALSGHRGSAKVRLPSPAAGSAMDIPLSLSPDLDRGALAAAFARDGRLKIPGLFPEPVAQRLHHCLTREVPWGLVYNEGDKAVVLDQATLRAMPREQRAALGQTVMQRAAQGYQYLYHTYPIVSAYLAGRDMQLYTHRLLEYLNDGEFLDFIRAVTGIPEIVKGDAQATLYAPGQFLKKHNDYMAGGNAKVAFVLNMTPRWEADWGGLLHFLEEDGSVTDSFVPAFNQLNIFRVPQLHSVSYVVPYAPAGRYAVTGWFRTA